MENILVTGATGFVGSNIMKRILRDYKFNNLVGIHLDNLSNDRLKYQGTDKGIIWANGSLEDYSFIERVVNMYEIDTIFHMAAVSIVRIASRSPLVAFKTNVQGTWNILEAARHSKTVQAFVGASSDKAYGVHKTLPYKEHFALNAVNTYDASKAMEDILIRTYASNYGLPAVVTRACNIYGPGDFNYSRVIPNSIRRLLNAQSPIIWKGVHEYLREFVYIDDLVEANLFLAEHADAQKGEAFNISTGDTWEVEDMINYISKVMGSNIKVSVVDKELEFLEIPEQYLSNVKLKELGWESKNTLMGSGAEKTIKWYTTVFEKGIK